MNTKILDTKLQIQLQVKSRINEGTLERKKIVL